MSNLDTLLLYMTVFILYSFLYDLLIRQFNTSSNPNPNPPSSSVNSFIPWFSSLTVPSFESLEIKFGFKGELI